MICGNCGGSGKTGHRVLVPCKRCGGTGRLNAQVAHGPGYGHGGTHAVMPDSDEGGHMGGFNYLDDPEELVRQEWEDDG